MSVDIILPAVASLTTIVLATLAWKYTIDPIRRYGAFLKRVGVSPAYWLPPPIGHMFQIPHDSSRLLEKFVQWARELRAVSKHKVVYVWMGSQPFMLISDAGLTEQVLKSTQFITKGFLYRFLLPWLHTGLLTSAGDKWRTRRKLLTPAFHFAILKSYFLTVREQAATLVEIIREAQEVALDVRDLITNCTLDIICEAAMGVHPNAQHDASSSRYVTAVKESNELIIQRMATPYYWPDFVYSLSWKSRKMREHLHVLHEFTRKAILARQKELEQSQPVWWKQLVDGLEGDELNLAGGKLPLLDLLLAAHKLGNKTKDGPKDSHSEGIDLAGVQEEVDTFMFEGHDTTASALAWTLQRLAENAPIQEKIYKELTDAGLTSNKGDRPIEFDDLAKLPYLEAVIKEVLRLYPPVPLLQRRIDVDTPLVIPNADGSGTETIMVPAGMQMILSPYILHHDPEHYEDPECFNPDRFLLHRMPAGSGTSAEAPGSTLSPSATTSSATISHTTRHPFAFIPFSAGPRNCIGQKFAQMEEKTILTEIIRHFRLIPLQSAESVGLKPDLLLRPKNPVMIKFVPR